MFRFLDDPIPNYKTIPELWEDFLSHKSITKVGHDIGRTRFWSEDFDVYRNPIVKMFMRSSGVEAATKGTSLPITSWSEHSAYFWALDSKLSVLILNEQTALDYDVEMISKYQTNLEVLSLSGCRYLTEDCHKHLAKLTSLVDLRLNSSSRYLCGRDYGKGVNTASVNFHELGDLGFGHLSVLTNLCTLDLGPYLVGVPKVMKVISQLPHLTNLRIQQGQLMSQWCFDIIGTMDQLIELHLYQTGPFINYGCFSNLKRLSVLSLYKSSITDEDLVHIESLPCLKILQLRNCRNITKRRTNLPKCKELIWFDSDYTYGWVKLK